MKRFKRIMEGARIIITELDALKSQCDKKAMKIACTIDQLHGKRVDQIQEGMLAKAASDNMKAAFPEPERNDGSS